MATRGRIEEKLREVVEAAIRFERFELVDLTFSKGSGRGLLRIVIDREGTGVSVEDCANISRELSAILDVEDVIPGSYVLEVSSPGLDRPLRNPGEYLRFAGRLAKVTLEKPLEDKRAVLVGRIVRVEGDRVVLEDGKDRTVSVAFADIKKARLEVEF